MSNFPGDEEKLLLPEIRSLGCTRLWTFSGGGQLGVDCRSGGMGRSRVELLEERMKNKLRWSSSVLYSAQSGNGSEGLTLNPRIT